MDGDSVRRELEPHSGPPSFQSPPDAPARSPLLGNLKPLGRKLPKPNARSSRSLKQLNEWLHLLKALEIRTMPQNRQEKRLCRSDNYYYCHCCFYCYSYYYHCQDDDFCISVLLLFLRCCQWQRSRTWPGNPVNSFHLLQIHSSGSKRKRQKYP